VLIPLRPKECDVLAYLLAHRDRVVSPDELLAQVWPGQWVGDATLHVRMRAIRQAIGDDGTTARLLRTVRGRGYRFVAPVVAGDAPGTAAAGSPSATLLEQPPVGGLPPRQPRRRPPRCGVHKPRISALPVLASTKRSSVWKRSTP
jgi:DNA-binding winged helix-turn-helix (wHTH) protein